MSEKKYEKAVAERVEFDNSDVITTSSWCISTGFDSGGQCADRVHADYPVNN